MSVGEPGLRRRCPDREQHGHSWRLFLLGLGLGLSLVVDGARCEQTDDLERVRVDLTALTRSLDADAGQLTRAREQSFRFERDIDATTAKQGAVQSSIEKKRKLIEQLRARRSGLESDLSESRALLEHNTIARYALATQSRLKLLLSQHEAGTLSRTLAYYDYVVRAYDRDFDAIRSQLQAISDTEAALKLETNALRRLRSENDTLLASLKRLRKDHAELVAAIEKRMADGNTRMKHLREDERRLTELLGQLGPRERPLATRAEFASLKGNLSWPAAGRIANAPGSALRSGGAQWAGVFIAGTPGDDVRAIAAAEVVFADWFRNLGKLVILDHGDGYMTLYGNNAEVHKKPGDSVGAGDTIATVGAGTGDMPAGVYFELRARGQPLDPRSWCAP